MKLLLLFGIFLCCLSVIMGAFGAHALKDRLSAYSMSIYDKAVLYQMFHSLAIIFTFLIGQILNSSQFNICSWIFLAGIIIFSGSLYLLSITDIKWLGAITPIGGMLFIIGWIVLFYLVLKLKI